jgi:hypothetical protein
VPQLIVEGQVVAKPFASVFPAEMPKDEIIFGLNFFTKRCNKATSIALINRIMARMHGCPAESDVMLHLYSGSKFPFPPKAYPPSLQRQPTPAEPLVWKRDIDTARIDGLVTHNTFSPRGIQEAMLPHEGDEVQDTPTAVYALPSIFNHSCHPNAVWCNFGDVIVIRARQMIPQGEEVTISYAPGEGTEIERKKKLESIIETQCDCPLCSADRTDGEAACQKRQRLLDEMSKKRIKTSTLVSAENNVQTITSTYCSEQSIPRPPLFQAYFFAMQVAEHNANKLGKSDLMAKSIQLGMKALEAAGFTGIDKRMTTQRKQLRLKLPLSKICLAAAGVNSDVCSLLMIHIAASFLMLSEAVCAERWFRAAWWGK